ncbi:MAG TPA: SDR family oxidoreductase [Gaiellaceae bacterium]
MQRLLVTGGCGYLGQELVGRAPRRGWTVRATWFERPPARDGDWVRVDVRDAEAVRAALDGVDAVIHTAYRQHADARAVNAAGSAVVATAARGRRLVHLSSDVVFRGDRGRYREEDEPDPVNDYGRSKAEGERLVAAAHPEATIVRTSLVYGRPDGPQERLARGHGPFFVDEIRSPVHVADLAEALLDVVAIDAAGPLHLGGADDVSRYAFAVLLGAREPQAAHTTADRAPNVTLDSSRAASLVPTRLRGVYEVLSSSAVRDAR